uniref:Peptidase M12B propeptide domain-containing protein n=1 Tax=Callorhinchus milii TaxID=7868 RepID=A0A4W3GFW7_CALMI
MADPSDRNSTEIADNSRLQYSVRFGGRTHVLHLVKAQEFLADTYSESHYLADGWLVTEARNNQNHCCYTGVVEGVEDSSVSLCVCHGLSGYVSIGDKAFTIDPVTDNSQEHKVTRSEHLRFKRHVPHLPSNRMGHKNELGIELFLVADR